MSKTYDEAKQQTVMSIVIKNLPLRVFALFIQNTNHFFFTKTNRHGF